MQTPKLNTFSIFVWVLLTVVCLLYLYSDHSRTDSGEAKTHNQALGKKGDSINQGIQQAGILGSLKEHFYSFNERDEWKRDMERACYELDKRIDKFQKDSVKLSGVKKDSLITYIASLKQKREEIQKKIDDEFPGTDEKKWDEFKNRVKTVWGEVETYANDIVMKIYENKEQ
jgi:hypothetical protein